MRASCIRRSLSGLCATALLAISVACGGGSKTTTTGNTTGTPGTSNPAPGGTSGTTTGGTGTGGTTTGGTTTGGGTGTTGGSTGTTGGTTGGTTSGGGTTGGGSGQQGQQFLFVAEQQDIQPFAIAPDGSLSAVAGVGHTARVGNTVNDMSGNSNRLYAVVDPGSSGGRGGTIASTLNLYGFTIDGSGNLTNTPGSPYQMTTFSQRILIHPAADLLLTLESFAVNSYRVASDGSASSVSSDNYFARFNFSDPSDIALSPSGNFLYVCSIRDNNRSDSKSGIAIYKVDHASGMLTPGTNLVELPEAPHALAITPSGKFLYAFTNDPFATTPRPDKIFAFNVNADGALTPLTGSPFTAAGGGEREPVMTPSGSYMLVRNFTSAPDSGIVVYKINSDGRPVAIPGSPFPVAPQAPSGLAIDKTGSFVYATDLNGKKIYGWKFDNNSGILTPLSWSPMGGVNFPSVITVTSTK